MKNRFRQLDDLVLDLKGLVLVRELLQERGASSEEIAAHEVEILRVRERLAQTARMLSRPLLEAGAQSSRRVVRAPRRAGPGGMRPAEIQLLT